MNFKRKQIRKNRKIKFSEDKYIEKYYLNEHNQAVIPIKLDNIDDLYMKHDYKKMELSDDVCKYIDEIAYMIPIETDIILEIHCPKKMNKKEEDRVKKTIKNNYGMEIDEIDYEISLQNRKSIILTTIGIILLTINIILDRNYDHILSNIICVIWWVAIWDMIEIQIMDKKELKERRLNYQQLYDTAILFVYKEK